MSDEVLCTGCYKMVEDDSLRSFCSVNVGLCPDCMKELKAEASEEVLLRVKETLKRLSYKPWKLIGTKWVYTQEDVEREFGWVK